MKRIFLVLFAVLLLVAGCGSEPKKEPPKAKSFGMDINTFVNKYNNVAKDAQDTVFLIGKATIEEGTKGKVLKHEFSPNCILIIAESNEAKNVDNVSTIASPKTPKDFAFFMVQQAAVVGVLHPNMPKEKRADLLYNLKILGNNNIKGLNESTIVDNVLYTAKETGGVITIIATPK